MPDHYWLTETQLERIRPYFPRSHGRARVDDRRVISGIIHVIRNGMRWRDAPQVYGSHKTLYNRFVRWSRMGIFDRIFSGLVTGGPDPSYFKFAFDRNPWDREVSWYSHQLSQGRFTGTFKQRLLRFPAHKVGNWEIYSYGGSVAVNFLGRYENLEADLATVLQMIGVQSGLRLGRLNSNHRDRSTSFRDWYDEESRELIRKTYAQEIELLNYSF